MSETAPPPGIDGSVGSLGASVAVSLLSLGLVCVLAYLALRWLSRRTPGFSHGPLRVLARQSLDPKRSVFVIEAAGRCFLVGAGEGAMTLLAELDREVMARELAPTKPTRGVPAALRGASAGFADVLARTLGRPAGWAPAPPLSSAMAPLASEAAPAAKSSEKSTDAAASTAPSPAPAPEGGLA